MTKNHFKSTLNVSGGQFDFQTDKHEGMIGISPASVVIWVDDIDADRDEPKNIGEFKNIDELLEKFNVDGEPFVVTILPKITELNMIRT
jgi:hypothetical protein